MNKTEFLEKCSIEIGKLLKESDTLLDGTFVDNSDGAYYKFFIKTFYISSKYNQLKIVTYSYCFSGDEFDERIDRLTANDVLALHKLIKAS